MCGITGFIDCNEDVMKNIKTLQKMCDCLVHRGPDSEGIWCDNFAALAHRRLAVVDIENGKQPMIRTKNGTDYIIVYNGELYNTEDIRKELLKDGFTFSGHSDTEVLLCAYIRWGKDCLYKLNGIYAFAIWNTKTKELFITRDRIGVKPLFYVNLGSSFIFASEIKALLCHPKVKPVIDKQGISELILLGPGRTPGCGVFKNIKELKPAWCGTFNCEGFKAWPYWSLKASEHTDNLDDTIEKVRFLVTDAVKRQLVSDVPICTFLSGGLDSSLISAIAANEFKLKGQKLDTVSVDYVDNDKYFKSSKFQPNSDAPWIKKMTDFLGTNHKETLIDTSELTDALFKATEARDLPGMADVDSSLLLFCEEIKKHFTVAISGECADEIFGGYPWYYNKDILFTDNFPWSTSLDHRYSFLKDNIMSKKSADEFVRQRYLETVNAAPKTGYESETDARMKEMMYLNFNWFMQTLLDRKDRMSMAYGLEVRVPFCDHRIVEYVYNIPWEMKYLKEREKGLLREAMSGLLPDDVLWRKKSPYPKTHNPNYLKAVKEKMDILLKSQNEPIFDVLQKDKIKEFIISDTDLNETWYGQLMSLPQTIAYFLQLNYWFKKYNIEII